MRNNLRPYPAEVMIVLGGGREKDGSLTELSRYRLDRAIELYRSGLTLRILLAIGHYSTWHPKAIRFSEFEADVRRAYLMKQGIPGESVIAIQDDDARDTLTEALVVRRWLKKREFRCLALVTSDKHMPRSQYIFRRVLGQMFTVDGYNAWCGDLLREEQEKAYLDVVRNYLEVLPAEIPDPPHWRTWYRDNYKFYEECMAVLDRYKVDGKEVNQAYRAIEG
jgi:uncharacterized SAM-binding protein YcdF (DUF218 family)